MATTHRNTLLGRINAIPVTATFSAGQRAQLRNAYASEPEDVCLATLNANPTDQGLIDEAVSRFPAQGAAPTGTTTHVDVSEEYQLKWTAIPTTLPTVHQLKDFLLTAPDFQIPLLDIDMETVSTMGLEPAVKQFFVRSPDGRHCHNFFARTFVPISLVPHKGTTEESHHAYWDGVTGPTMTPFKDLQMNRNTSDDTSTGNDRPDWRGYYFPKDTGIDVRSEEKIPGAPDDPTYELVKKLEKWPEGAPYLLAYSAVGKAIRYHYIVHARNPNNGLDYTLFSVGSRFNFDLPSDRIKASFIVRNMFRLLQDLNELSTGIPRVPSPLNRDSGEIIEIEYDKNFVVKKINQKALEAYKTDGEKFKERLNHIYSLIADRNIKYCDRKVTLTTTVTKKENYIRLKLQPVGYVSRPTDRNGVIRWLWCIATALKGLHALNIIHRDIRWPNIMRYLPGDSKMDWFLIDFTDAYIPDYPDPRKLGGKKGNHSPHVNSFPCSHQVDMWGLGHALQELVPIHLDVDQLVIPLKDGDYTAETLLAYLQKLP